jgi:hypothetical protein
MGIPQEGCFLNYHPTPWKDLFSQPMNSISTKTIPLNLTARGQVKKGQEFKVVPRF